MPMSAEWSRIVASARAGELTPGDVASLAARLADSGAKLDLRGRSTADLASTGGPGSLSTMICPPMLVAGGWDVPKLGVPGRPAGGVDVLSGIQGYDVALDAARALAVLAACGYVHVDAGDIFAPADAALFQYRQSVGAQAFPDLAIASLLSKKLAMDVRRVGLEVRIAQHGNFGADAASGRRSANRFVEVASLLGLDAICVLTDASRPFQPYIGRGEALVALTMLIDGDEGDWLGSHFSDCRTMARLVAGAASATIERTTVMAHFLSNVEAQGGSIEALRARAAEVQAAHVRRVAAPSDGYVEYDLGHLRTAISEAQGPRSPGAPRWADEAGVILRARPGERVKAGATLLTARCPERDWAAMCTALAAAVSVERTAAPARNAIVEVVGV